MARNVPGTPAAFALLALCAALALLGAPARADEGMWTLDNLPVKALQDRYAFTPSAGWIEHVQKASINFGGGSGSFVSADGLVLTNHHVAMGQLAKVSTPKHDYLKDGFFARTRAEEMPCPDLELKVLESFSDVTARVLGAAAEGASDREAHAQRRAETARIEKDESAKSGLKAEVVELYDGGEYWVYRYKTYKDVRLVFAPEEQAAFFGGDLDNFCYPRHDLDFAFFRVYEGGRPVRPKHWFSWSTEGAHEGDLVFVSGNPGTTRRQRTLAQLYYERANDLPVRIRLNEQRVAAYRAYESRGPEQARQARDRIRGLENNLKRQRGFLEILSDPNVMEKKRVEEGALRDRVKKDERAAKLAQGAWGGIEDAQRVMIQRSTAYIVRDWARVSRLVDIAEGVVRLPAELAKPNDQRLPDYRESNLESQRFRLFSPAPVYPEMEEMIIGVMLQQCLDELGPDDAFVKAALGGRAPRDVAHELVAGTKLADPAARRALVEGGTAAVEASTDPLVVWARRLDPMYRELRSWYEDNVRSIETRDGGLIARARFVLDGKSLSPDATRSLRLSYGRVAGYPQLTTRVPPFTTFAGLWDRSDGFAGKPPFDLPARIAAHKRDVDPNVPLNFVCTDDIIGGNSGSPVLNRAGELVGLVFDGNVQAFDWDYFYTDEQARCVAVDARAILEALRKIYGATGIVAELEGKTAGR